MSQRQRPMMRGLLSRLARFTLDVKALTRRLQFLEKEIREMMKQPKLGSGARFAAPNRKRKS